jgi:hypothetical protein
MILLAGKKACSENNLTHIQGYSSVGRAAVSKCKRMFVCLFFCNFLETTISNSSQKFSESQISILELFFFKEIKSSKRIRKIIKRTAKKKNASKSTQKTIFNRHKKRF